MSVRQTCRIDKPMGSPPAHFSPNSMRNQAPYFAMSINILPAFSHKYDTRIAFETNESLGAQLLDESVSKYIK